MNMKSEVIRTEIEGGVAHLVMDRPGKANAMGEAFWRDLPLLIETRSTPEMLESFIRTLAPDYAIEIAEITALFSETRGNLREALWRCYDRVSEAPLAR